MTCPVLKSTATLNGLSASNNFIDTISTAEAANGKCFVGWFQRSETDIPDLNLGVWTDSTNAARVGLIVGSELTFQLTVPLKTTAAGTWFDMSPSGNFFDIDILAIEDPGLPLNMSLSRSVFGTSGSCNYAMCRTGRWTPIRGQEDRTWQAHFVASSQCCANGECLDPSFSSIVSVFLPVSGPISRWSADTRSLPKSVALTVGESRSLELQCNANHGVPVIAIANMSRNGAPSADGAGLDHALFESTAAAVQCSPGSPANPLRCTATATVLVTAVPGDEGSVREWCFTCGDARGVRVAEETCVRVATRLCEYRVQPGDTLRSVSRRFYRDSGWVRLWNANPGLLDPDLGRSAPGGTATLSGTELLQPGLSLRLGPVYTVKYGDTLTTIAGMLETTIKALVASNPHLEVEAGLEPGADLCVLACSSHAAPGSTVPGA